MGASAPNLRPMEVPVDRSSALTRHVCDVALVVLLLVADVIELRFLHSLFWPEREIATLPLLTAFALIRAGALLLRRLHPIAASIIVSATMITVPTHGLSYLFRSFWPAFTPVLGGDPGWWPTAFGWTALLEVLISVYTVAALRGRRPAIGVGAWHMLCIAPWFLPQVVTWGPGPLLIGPLVLGIPIYLGGVRRRTIAVISQVETRRDRIDSGRREGATDAARIERERISDELQGLVAEHLRKMVEQARIARTEVETSGSMLKTREAIAAIERTGRAALTDARRALGLLREDSLPVQQSAPISSERDIKENGISLGEDSRADGTEHHADDPDGSKPTNLVFTSLLSAYFLSEIGGNLPPWRALGNLAHFWDITAMLLIVTPFVFVRRVPLLMSLLVTGGFALHASAGHFFGIASVIALLAGVYTVWAVKGLAQGLAAFTAAALVLPLAEEQLAGVFQFGLLTIYFPFLPAACFFGWQERKLGSALEVLRRQEAELRLIAEEERERARLEERLRIARELHDVSAHTLSVMTIQAGAARTVADKAPAQARRALRLIEETGRRAQGEIDGLFSGSVEATEQARLGLDALPSLVEDMRAAGLYVELDLSPPQEPLPRGLDISLYRVVQEALTNAVKHAGPTRVRIRIECTARASAVEVVDEGAINPPSARTSRSSTDHPGGRGLIGIQERVKAYGGTMNAGSRGRGFSVQVSIPINHDEVDAVGSELR